MCKGEGEGGVVRVRARHLPVSTPPLSAPCEPDHAELVRGLAMSPRPRLFRLMSFWTHTGRVTPGVRGRVRLGLGLGF